MWRPGLRRFTDIIKLWKDHEMLEMYLYILWQTAVTLPLPLLWHYPHSSCCETTHSCPETTHSYCETTRIPPAATLPALFLQYLQLTMAWKRMRRAVAVPAAETWHRHWAQQKQRPGVLSHDWVEVAGCGGEEGSGLKCKTAEDAEPGEHPLLMAFLACWLTNNGGQHWPSSGKTASLPSPAVSACIFIFFSIPFLLLSNSKVPLPLSFPSLVCEGKIFFISFYLRFIN